MLECVSKGEPRGLDEAIRSFNSEAENGNAHAESTLAFLYASGYGVQQSDAKAFLFHYFASQKGNLQSKMALAYSYSRQQVSGFVLYPLQCATFLALSAEREVFETVLPLSSLLGIWSQYVK
jgi:TPR repeat protein